MSETTQILFDASETIARLDETTERITVNGVCLTPDHHRLQAIERNLRDLADRIADLIH